jgi:hypothetical protein
MGRPGLDTRAGCVSVLGGLLLGLAVAGCTGERDFGGGGQDGSGQCPALSPQEITKTCNEAFTQCLGTSIQGIRGEKYKHSHCVNCRNVCMRQSGAWPAQVEGTPCQ